MTEIEEVGNMTLDNEDQEQYVPKYPQVRITSGGADGVDITAVVAAHCAGFATGGSVPNKHLNKLDSESRREMLGELGFTAFDGGYPDRDKDNIDKADLECGLVLYNSKEQKHMTPEGKPTGRGTLQSLNYAISEKYETSPKFESAFFPAPGQVIMSPCCDKRIPCFCLAVVDGDIESLMPYHAQVADIIFRRAEGKERYCVNFSGFTEEALPGCGARIRPFFDLVFSKLAEKLDAAAAGSA